jgi:general nucleoside transport system permease protein
MTATATPLQRSNDRLARLPLWAQYSLGAAGIMLLLTIAGRIADTPDLTSSGAYGSALRLAVPIGMAGLGGLYAERAGQVNIGLEGMMAMGTWMAGWAGWHWGPWAAIVGGAVGGLIFGLLHAVTTVTFGVNHIVSGVAINILAVGVTRFLSEQLFEGQPSASATLSPPIPGSLPRVSLPLLSGGFGTPDLLGWLEKRHWFYVSDVAGLAKGLTTNLSWATVIAMALFPITAYVLWKTAFGLRLRACGERPSAADSLGVPVYRMKYIAVMISGALAGFGGATLVLQTGQYREGMTANRGFLGLAALIFGNWRPIGVAAGSALFGYADALQLRPGDSVRGLILFGALALTIVAGWRVYQRKLHAAMVLAIAAAVTYLAYLNKPSWFWGSWLYESDSLAVDSRIVFMTPYLVTLLVLSFASQRLRPPAADGLVWRKGQTE